MTKDHPSTTGGCHPYWVEDNDVFWVTIQPPRTSPRTDSWVPTGFLRWSYHHHHKRNTEHFKKTIVQTQEKEPTGTMELRSRVYSFSHRKEYLGDTPRSELQGSHRRGRNNYNPVLSPFLSTRKYPLGQTLIFSLSPVVLLENPQDGTTEYVRK